MRTGPFWDGVEGRAPVPPAARTLGFAFVAADEHAGTIEVDFTAGEEFTNPAGNVLGAFLAAMLYDTVGPALLAAAAASALFIAPTAFHRLRFEDGDKPFLVKVSSKMALAGLGFLAVAMNGAVLLVTDVLFDGVAVTITVALSVTVFVGLWFVLGLVREFQGRRSD